MCLMVADGDLLLGTDCDCVDGFPTPSLQNSARLLVWDLVPCRMDVPSRRAFVLSLARANVEFLCGPSLRAVWVIGWDILAEQ